MKNIIYSILVCLPFVFGACDKSTDDTSKVTYFVTLEREGDEKIVLEKGQPFVEPGYYAEMNGEDITESVQIKGSVDVNTPGIYNLVYAAYNEDGFAKTFTRTVYVADNTASPLKSGIYTVAEGSKRTAPSVVAFSGYYVAGWGDSMDQMTNTLLDPATGTLKWTVAYAGQLSFDIIVKQ